MNCACTLDSSIIGVRPPNVVREVNKIARKHNTTSASLARYNGISLKGYLQIGQKIKLPPTYKTHVVRSGGWYDTAKYLRCTYRGGVGPSYKDNTLGFRLVRAGRTSR